MSRRNVSCGRATRSPVIASASVASSSRPSSSTGALTSFHVSGKRQAAAALGEPTLDRLKPQSQRLQRLDREPALERPLAQRDTVPGDERGIQMHRIVDAEIRELRPDARLVDRAVPPVAARKGNVRLERRLDELRVGHSPPEPGEHADMASVDKAEAARPDPRSARAPRGAGCDAPRRRTSSSPRTAGSRTGG